MSDDKGAPPPAPSPRSDRPEPEPEAEPYDEGLSCDGDSATTELDSDHPSEGRRDGGASGSAAPTTSADPDVKVKTVSPILSFSPLPMWCELCWLGFDAWMVVGWVLCSICCVLHLGGCCFCAIFLIWLNILYEFLLYFVAGHVYY